VAPLPLFKTLTIFAGCALATLSCANAASVPGRYTLLISSAKGAGWKPVTQTFVLVADNQTQHLYGDPLWMRGGLAPIVMHAAVRPLQLEACAR
jgi:hypothetical protein